MNQTQDEVLKSFYSLDQLTGGALERMIELARRGKRLNWSQYSSALRGKVVGLVFLSPSLRTRTSFQAGIMRLGGDPLELKIADGYPLETREGLPMLEAAEHVKEAVRVISRYVDLMCVRTFAYPDKTDSWENIRKDEMWKSFEKYSEVPLINMESALWHPCQSLADTLTLQEHFGTLGKRRFVLSWAPHPRSLVMAVPNSTLTMACQSGMDVTLACPEGYELDPEVMAKAKSLAEMSGGSCAVEHDQNKAFKDAEVVYAKSWSPPRYIGRFEEEQERRKELGHWQISDKQMKNTNDAAFMHCLPVRRNVIVSDSVIDSPKSLVIDQAENRMHAQNALLLSMFGRV